MVSTALCAVPFLETISRGTLKATKAGNQWLIEKKDMEQFVPRPGRKPKRK
jgi:hypothetical protein